MRKYKCALILAAGLVMPLAASAADLGGYGGYGGYKDTPYAVMYWQGLYLGANLGAAVSTASVNDSFNYVGDPHIHSSGASTGLLGGAQAGYNIQRDHVVFGLEGDIGYLGISANSSGSYIQPAGTHCSDAYGRYSASSGACNVSSKYDTSGGLYGDITGRLGYAADRVLLYTKGGVAFLDAKTNANYTGGSVRKGLTSHFAFSDSDTLVGWTIGAGAEYALNPAWSLKAEYQHFDFGNMSYDYSGTYYYPSHPGWNARITDGKNEVSLAADTVKVGVSYHVGN